MTKNEKRTLLVIIIIAVVFSTIAFVVPFIKNSVFWISYVFAIIAVLVQLYILKSAFGKGESQKSKFYGFPIARIGAIYQVAQLILSLIFMTFSTKAPIWIAIVLYVVILGIAAIGFVAADMVRDEVEKQDIKIETDIACISKLRTISASLVELSSENEIKHLLQELADEFRYSDPVSSDATEIIENELEELLQVLQNTVIEAKNDETTILCKKIKIRLIERNRICKAYKKR